MPEKPKSKPRNTFRAAEHPENAWLGYLLWKLRKDSGLSQTQLGKKLGRSHTYLNRVESGVQPIDIATLFRHCQITGADAVELIRIVRDDPPELSEEFLNRPKGRVKKAK